MDEKQIEEIIMQLVVKSGDARSIAMEAIGLAQKKQFDESCVKIGEARSRIAEAHDIQTNMITQAVNGEDIPMSLLMCHAQDHLMTAMVVIDLGEKFIELYKKID